MAPNRVTSGASPPPGFAWQLGRTATDVKFVNDAARYIVDCNDFAIARRLSRAIDAVKAGTLKFSDWTSPEQYLESKD